MKDNHVIFASVMVRAVCILACVAGTVYLADKGKDGWGWLIFLAVVFGSYSIKSNKDEDAASISTKEK